MCLHVFSKKYKQNETEKHIQCKYIKKWLNTIYTFISLCNCNSIQIHVIFKFRWDMLNQGCSNPWNINWPVDHFNVLSWSSLISWNFSKVQKPQVEMSKKHSNTNCFPALTTLPYSKERDFSLLYSTIYSWLFFTSVLFYFSNLCLFGSLLISNMYVSQLVSWFWILCSQCISLINTLFVFTTDFGTLFK